MTSVTFLQGERVVLRPIERDDAEFLQRAPNEPDIRVPGGYSHPQNRSQIESYVENDIEDDDGVNLLVCLDDEPIGAVNVMNLRWTRPMLSYWIVPERHGEGLATEAVSLVLDYFFETFESRGIQAFVYDFNDASVGLLEKLGFVREGVSRDDRFVRGEYVDMLHFGLLREEWAG